MTPSKFKSFLKHCIAETIVEGEEVPDDPLSPLLRSTDDTKEIEVARKAGHKMLYTQRAELARRAVMADLKAKAGEKSSGLDEINHTTDDRGNSVIAVGSPGSLARFVTEHPDLIKQMREWVADCQWADVQEPEDLNYFDDIQILRGVEKFYDGGIKQFILDGGENNITPPISENKISHLVKECVLEVLKENLSEQFPNHLLKELKKKYITPEQRENNLRILFESPMRFGDFNVKINDNAENYSLCKKIKEQGKHIGKYKEYEIYEYIKNDETTNIFTSGDLIMVMFVFTVENNIMKEKVVWQHITNYGVGRDILLNYYLNKYKGVISDELHSPAGEKYWKKLLPQALQDGYKIYAINIETNESQLLKLDDINKFYGYTPESQAYRFMILRKNLSNEAFDPQSVGPNPEASEGTQTNPYPKWNSEMRKMEESKPNTKSIIDNQWDEGEDGYWIQLKPGWTVDDSTAIHELTKQKALQRLKDAKYTGLTESDHHGRYSQISSAGQFDPRTFGPTTK